MDIDYFADDADISPEHAQAGLRFAAAVADERLAEDHLIKTLADHQDTERHSPVDITDWPFVMTAAQQLLGSRKERKAAEKDFRACHEMAVATASALRLAKAGQEKHDPDRRF